MGEGVRAQGIDAENTARVFLRDLGYRILKLNISDYNIDCLARFPKESFGFGLRKPCYSPEGLTAFEITSEERVRKRKVVDFAAKIKKYNANNTEKIRGGVLLVDQKIPQSFVRLMEKESIFGWGHDRQVLYSAKIRTFVQWRKEFYLFQVDEVPLDATTTYLRCSTPPRADDQSPRSRNLVHYAIFCDDQSRRIQVEDILRFAGEIRATLVPVLKAGISRFGVHLEFHSLGGISANREDILKAIGPEWEKEGILLDLPQNAFTDYHTFPTLHTRYIEDTTGEVQPSKSRRPA
jgi:hypothetical protein